MKMNISFRQLELFCEIASKGSVSRAAEKTDISQSAASMALAELEKQIGEKLFDRLGKKLILNSSGKRLLPKAKEILSRVDEVEKMFSGNRNQPAGEINIGASSTIGNYVLPELLGKFSNQNPEIQINLTVGNTEQIIESLLSFETDAGYIEGLCNDNNIETSIWQKDQLVVFSSPDHPLASKTEITPGDLTSSQWILREKGSGTRVIFENALTGHITDLNIRYELGHTEAVKNAVKNNLGISCLSKRTVKENLENGSLVELNTPFLQLARNFYLLIRKEKYRTLALNQFLTFLGDSP